MTAANRARDHGRRAPDGERFTAPDTALVQFQINGLPHRCIRTRQIGGQRLQAYNYDGGTR